MDGRSPRPSCPRNGQGCRRSCSHTEGRAAGMSGQIGYQTPAAFRRALTDRLKGLAKESRWTLPQLQRQIAYDRILERLYMVNEAWVIKGATALIARKIGVRGTI